MLLLRGVRRGGRRGAWERVVVSDNIEECKLELGVGLALGGEELETLRPQLLIHA